MRLSNLMWEIRSRLTDRLWGRLIVWGLEELEGRRGWEREGGRERQGRELEGGRGRLMMVHWITRVLFICFRWASWVCLHVCVFICLPYMSAVYVCRTPSMPLALVTTLACMSYLFICTAYVHWPYMRALSDMCISLGCGTTDIPHTHTFSRPRVLFDNLVCMSYVYVCVAILVCVCVHQSLYACLICMPYSYI